MIWSNLYQFVSKKTQKIFENSPPSHGPLAMQIWSFLYLAPSLGRRWLKAKLRKVYLTSYRYSSTCSTLGPQIVITSSKYIYILYKHLSEGSTIIFSHTISDLNTTNPCHPSRSPSPLAVLASMQGLVAYDGRPLIHVDPQDWTAINRNQKRLWHGILRYIWCNISESFTLK